MALTPPPTLSRAAAPAAAAAAAAAAAVSLPALPLAGEGAQRIAASTWALTWASNTVAEALAAAKHKWAAKNVMAKNVMAEVVVEIAEVVAPRRHRRAG